MRLFSGKKFFFFFPTLIEKNLNEENFPTGRIIVEKEKQIIIVDEGHF